MEFAGGRVTFSLVKQKIFFHLSWLRVLALLSVIQSIEQILMPVYVQGWQLSALPRFTSHIPPRGECGVGAFWRHRDGEHCPLPCRHLTMQTLAKCDDCAGHRRIHNAVECVF